MSRPPIRSVPFFAACPACSRILRTRVDFTHPDPCAALPCPWCGRDVVVCVSDCGP